MTYLSARKYANRRWRSAANRGAELDAVITVFASLTKGIIMQLKTPTCLVGLRFISAGDETTGRVGFRTSTCLKYYSCMGFAQKPMQKCG